MGNAMLYEVTNIKTGEMFCGTAADMAAKFNVTPGHINKLALEGKRIHLDWKIVQVGYKSDVEKEKTNNCSIPLPMQEEWDRVTAPFKAASRKKALGVLA